LSYFTLTLLRQSLVARRAAHLSGVSYDKTNNDHGT
jgi:hypothetical protein